MFRHNNIFRVFRFIALNFIVNKRLWSLKQWKTYEKIFTTLLLLLIIGLYGVYRNTLVCYEFFFSYAAMLFGFFGISTLEYIWHPPRNSPSQYLQDQKSKNSSGQVKEIHIENDTKYNRCGNKSSNNKSKSMLVCIGDSITHGHCSANFVDMIAKNMRTNDETQDTLQILNAGKNSICTWPFLHSSCMDDVLACNPDYVSILIGTNDVKGIYRDEWKKQSISLWNIPEDISFQNYEHNLKSIIERLLVETNAKISVCTLPPLGEDLQCRANNLVRNANEIIKDVVSKCRKKSGTRISIISVFEEFEKTLENSEKKEHRNFHQVENFLVTEYLMIFCHTVFGFSLTTLSKIINHQLMSDSLHLNEKGAEIVAKLIIKWIS